MFRAVWPPTERAFARWFADPDPLLRVKRVTLCDLLTGRMFRIRAAELLAEALELEQRARDRQAARGWPRPSLTMSEMVSHKVDHAANLERVALLAETGQMLWGERISRDYQSPDDSSDDALNEPLLSGESR